MMVVFSGKGCFECPFYQADYFVNASNLSPDGYSCTLDERATVDGQLLSIKLGEDGKRRGDCPFMGGPKQIEIGSEE